MGVVTLRGLIPTTLLISVMLGLVGVAFGQDAPDTWPVETPYGAFPVGHFTLPAALVLFGTLLSRSIDRVAAWRPSIQLVLHLEHHYPEGSRAETPPPGPTPDG